MRPVYTIGFHLPSSCRASIRRFFGPAHQIDRWFRPVFWSSPIEILTPEEQERYLSEMTPEELQELNNRKAQWLSNLSQKH